MDKQLEERIANAKKLKQEPFDWDKIKRFFQLSEKRSAYQVIFIDRTSSKVGQQMLYATLRTIHQNRDRIEQFEKIIRLIDEHPTIKKTLLGQLATLTNTNAYAITSLFLKKHNPKPGWFWLVKGLAIVSVCCVLLSLVFPQTLLLLLPLLAVNFSIHYWNKKNLYQYAGSIPQLARMHQVAKQFRQYEAIESLLEAGKKRLAGDTTREATAPEVQSIKLENEALKQLVAELSLENRVLKKSLKADD